jgi:protein-tyrosine phosphatase
MINTKITTGNPFKLCFVCLGNICRSPTAEGVFQHMVNERSLQPYFEVDSSGTSAYHIGESANVHSQRTANDHGITLHSKARRFEASDIHYFDLIIAMDRSNLANIKKLDAGNKGKDRIMLLREFDPEPENNEVPDPYSGGREGFENVFQIAKRSCKQLLDELEKHIEE